MKKLFLAIVAAALIAFVGCQKEEPVNDNPVNPPIDNPDTPDNPDEPDNPDTPGDTTSHETMTSLAATLWHASDSIVVPMIGIELIYGSDLRFETDSTGSIDVEANMIPAPQQHAFTYTFDGENGVFTAIVNGEAQTSDFQLLDSIHMKVAVDPALINDTTGMLQSYTGGRPVTLTYTKQR